nr:glycoside hydrolase family 38 C-terminal domain-containing protein [Cohnella faecalis]
MERSHKLLKAAFGFDLTTDKAAYEIPFGAIERPTHRNTSWEQAQYEVCGHRWADVSESGCGVALLNDCKYGYDIREGTMRLSLLRAPKWPDVTADQGWHEFVYSVYPHGGGWRRRMWRASRELNSRRQSGSAYRARARTAAGQHSEARCRIVIPSCGWKASTSCSTRSKRRRTETIRFLRFLRIVGRTRADFRRLPEPLSRVVAVGALELEEEDAEELTLRDGGFELSFRPYEIKTIKLIR